MRPNLNSQERRVLLEIHSLWPDGDSSDLRIKGLDSEALSYILQRLEGHGLIDASRHDMGHPLAPYFRDVLLTAYGEDVRRQLKLPQPLRFLAEEWKWLAAFLIGAIGLGLALLNRIDPP